MASSPALSLIKGLLAEESQGRECEPKCPCVACALTSSHLSGAWVWGTDPFTFRKWEDIVLRYPFGTLRASQMCRWGQVRLRWWQGGSQWPALIILHSAHRGEGRQVRSEFSCMGEKVLDLQRATEMGVGRCLRLLFHAGVWGWETKDENAFGIWDFRPCSPLRSGIPQVYCLLLCLVIISTILLFSLLSAPTVFLEFKCISYWTLYSVKDYSLVPSQEEVIRSGLPCPDSSLFSILWSYSLSAGKVKVLEILNHCGGGGGTFVWTFCREGKHLLSLFRVFSSYGVISLTKKCEGASNFQKPETFKFLPFRMVNI